MNFNLNEILCIFMYYTPQRGFFHCLIQKPSLGGMLVHKVILFLQTKNIL